MVLLMVVGGALVLAGAGMAIGACLVGYRLARSYERQLELEQHRYGPVGPPGM